MFTPNRCAPIASRSPRSRPTWPKVVLHDTTNPSSSEPPQRSSPKFFSVLVVSGSGSSFRCGNFLFTSMPSASAVAGGDGLERRARRVDLAPRAREQRAVGRGEQELARELRGLRVVRREEVRIEGRVRVHGDDAAGLHVEHDDRSAPAGERGGRDCLGLGRQGQHDGAGHRLARDELAEVLGRHAEVAAGELRRVLGLDADRTELDRLVADDLREQLGGGRRVDALVLELVVARHRLRDARPRRRSRSRRAAGGGPGGTCGCCAGRRRASCCATTWR